VFVVDGGHWKLFHAEARLGPKGIVGEKIGLDGRSQLEEVERVDEHRIAWRFWLAERFVVERLDAELGRQDRDDHAAQPARKKKEGIKRLIDHSCGFILDEAEVEWLV